MAQITKSQAKAIADVGDVAVGKLTRSGMKSSLDKLTSLTSSIFITDILKTLDFKEDPFTPFYRRDAVYGNGVRYVSAGFITGKEYKRGTYTPDQIGSMTAPDYEDFSSAEIKLTYPLIFNEQEMVYYFKNYENLAGFMNQVRDANNISFANDRLNSFLYIFGNNDVALESYIKTQLDKVKAKMLRTEDLGEVKDMREVFKKFQVIGKAMGGKGMPATDKWNIGFTKDSYTGAKINKSTTSDDLILIVSANDMLDLSEETADVFHQAFYSSDNKFYKVIEADIPRGTAWLIDKEALRVYPKLYKVIGEAWMDMSTTITTHVFSHWGVFKYANGTKITWTIKAPAAAAAIAAVSETEDTEPEKAETPAADTKEPAEKVGE